MARLRVPRAAATEIDGVALLEGEIVHDTTNDNLRLGDGSTLGGKRLVDVASDLTISSAMTPVVQAATTDAGVGALNGVLEVGTKAALSALSAGVVDAVVVRGRTSAGDGYQGIFHWRSGDQSANITADPAGAIWVAPNSAPTGASGAWQRIYNGAIQVAWFDPVGNGTSDDLTPLTRFLNAVMASSGRCGELEAKTYAVSGALPNINVSGVVITGAGPSSSHDVGSGPTGTLIKAITNSGFTILTVAPTTGASAQRLDAVRIIGVGFHCNSLAAKGLLVQSVFRGEFDVYTQEATTSGLEVGVVTTLGEARDTQRCRFRLIGRQYTNSAPALRLKGDSGANVSFNTFEYVDVGHYNGSGVICENADNNIWNDIRVIRAAGGAATYSIEWLGGATDAERVRGEIYDQISTTVAAVARGTGTYTYGAGPIYIDRLDTENGSPKPIAEAGASVYIAAGVKGTDAPAAATTDLARYGAEFTDITGSGATITSFGVVRPGAVRRVRFLGVNTIVNNDTSLILPRSTNIVTAAGDTATLVSLGGTGYWLLLDYKRQTDSVGLPGWRVLASSAVATASHTGTTAETTLVTVPIPANAMGPNGGLRVRVVYTCTASVNNKTLRVRLGGISGDAMHSQIIASSFNAFCTNFTIQNRNSASSQIGTPSSGAGLGGTTTGQTTGTQNTALAKDLVMTVELASAGESISIESYIVEVFYKP